MKMENPLEPAGRAALAASREMLALEPEEKAQALRLMAAGVRNAAEKIIRENVLDMEEARKSGRNSAFLDRLLLTPDRVEHMACGIEQVAALPDPVGECIREWTRPNGLRIRQVRVPLGVIGFIYESRGTVTCDAAALCLKSGNAVILRGGSESLRTNRVLAETLRSALEKSAVPADAVRLLDSGSRDEVRQLCELDSCLNVIIPRGGKGLIRAVTEFSKVPVLKHLDGICHVYVDAAADLEMAVNVLDDAKTQRPGVCNAAETLLVDAAAAERFCLWRRNACACVAWNAACVNGAARFLVRRPFRRKKGIGPRNMKTSFCPSRWWTASGMPWNTLTATGPTTVIPSLRRINGHAIIL